MRVKDMGEVQSLSPKEKVLYYSDQVCSLIDRGVDVFLKQLELKRKMVALDKERRQIDFKIKRNAGKLSLAVEEWGKFTKDNNDKKD